MSKEKSKWLAKGVEYYPESGTLLLIRCPKCGRENWAPQVAAGGDDNGGEENGGENGDTPGELEG